MKNTFILSMILFVCGLGYSQNFKGLDKSPLDMIEYPTKGTAKWARILYGRPQLKGRDISTLVPEGKVWRTGANESTELTLYTPLIVGGTKLPIGSYTLYSIPMGNEITIIINKATHVWGAYSYNQNMDIKRITVPLTESGEYIEAFSMIFEKGVSGMDLNMGWGYYRATLPFTK